MASHEMSTLVGKARENSRKKKSQASYGIGILIAVMIGFLMMMGTNKIYAWCWMLGTAIGVILRSSRFCFASAFRDPFLVGNTRLLRGMIIAMMVSSVGFAFIHNSYFHSHEINYEMIPGAVTSVGLHVAIGAFLFGVGMVIAGGCSSGVLMRIGEGYALHWIVLVGFFIGTLLGARDYGFWHEHIIKNAKTIYFPEIMDIRLVLLLQLIFLGGLYRLVLWYENKYWKKG